MGLSKCTDIGGEHLDELLTWFSNLSLYHSTVSVCAETG